MATVVREGDYALSVYPNDHPPPHAHVRWRDGEARVNLLTLTVLSPDQAPAAAVHAVRKHVLALYAKWDEYHPKKGKQPSVKAKKGARKKNKARKGRR